MPNLGGVQGCPSLTTIDFIDDGSIVGIGLAVCHGTLDSEVILDERYLRPGCGRVAAGLRAQERLRAGWLAGRVCDHACPILRMVPHLRLLRAILTASEPLICGLRLFWH